MILISECNECRKKAVIEYDNIDNGTNKACLNCGNFKQETQLSESELQDLRDNYNSEYEDMKKENQINEVE